jgi:hypothetical protein
MKTLLALALFLLATLTWGQTPSNPNDGGQAIIYYGTPIYEGTFTNQHGGYGGTEVAIETAWLNAPKNAVEPTGLNFYLLLVENPDDREVSRQVIADCVQAYADTLRDEANWKKGKRFPMLALVTADPQPLVENEFTLADGSGCFEVYSKYPPPTWVY